MTGRRVGVQRSRLSRISSFQMGKGDNVSAEQRQCPHEKRKEIAAPQKNVEHGRLADLRLWFCFDCGEKWETREDMGEVDSIELRINLT